MLPQSVSSPAVSASAITVTSPVARASVKEPLTITGRAPVGQTVFLSSVARGATKLSAWSWTTSTDPDASENFILEDFDLDETPAEFSLVVYHIKDGKWINTVSIPLKIAP